MFFNIGFPVFLLLSGYTYLRLRSMIVTRRSQILFTLFYGLIIVVFPCTEIMSHSDTPVWTNRILLYGYLTLPYLLYVFLFVLALDILRGINRILKLTPPLYSMPTAARSGIISLVLGLPALIILAGYIHNTDLQVNKFPLDIPRRSSPLEHLTIAVASDFHLRELTGVSVMRSFADRMNELNADILLLPGDILEGDRQEGRIEEFAREFRRIITRYGVYGSPGNHESHGEGGRRVFFQSAGITLLEDSAVCIDRAFWLIGRNDSRLRGRQPIEELTKSLADSLPVIVLDHRPTDLETIKHTAADIVVCGHTHNGQLWPLNYITGGIYDVSWGHKKLGSLHVFVTSGVQVWGPPVRTTGDAEIMLITVTLN